MGQVFNDLFPAFINGTGIIAALKAKLDFFSHGAIPDRTISTVNE
jgi:hypothetical protein